MDWTIHINDLIHWANEKGYHVEIVKNGDDSICPISKIIEINSCLKPSVQVIRLLHECGHVLVFENGSIFNFKDKRDYKKESTPHKVFSVIEEVEAWKRSKELAKRLKIPIEEAEWEEDMVKALKKYINWASDLKEKGEKNAFRRSRINKGNKSSETGSKCGDSTKSTSE